MISQLRLVLPAADRWPSPPLLANPRVIERILGERVGRVCGQQPRATESAWFLLIHATMTANSITLHPLVPSIARKVVVVTPAKVRRVMIAGRCSCGQRLLKGMIRCPGCGRDLRNLRK